MAISATEAVAAIRPRSMTTTRSAVSAISAGGRDENETVRLSAASALTSLPSHETPSGSSPSTGSSRISAAGSPSSAAAMPRRRRRPSEQVLTGSPITVWRPTMATR
ncbi:MAG: hypothetical protein LBG60_12130 [Bifidobacteriaceae bacterium]|nr:hypothetical protein [Bifidobacteriaceae bacterium]